MSTPTGQSGSGAIQGFSGYYEGFHYVLGSSAGLYMICLKDEAGNAVKIISTFPSDNNGWEQAWYQFVKLEPNPKPYQPKVTTKDLPFARKDEPQATHKPMSSIWSESALERPGIIQEGSVNLKLTSNVKVKKRWDLLVVTAGLLTTVGIIARLLLLKYGRLHSHNILGLAVTIDFYRYGSYVLYALGFLFGMRGRKRILESGHRFKGMAVAWISILVCWGLILVALFADLYPKIHELISSL